MFRLVCLVEDKHLAKVLTNLSGLVVNMEAPQPVVNAVVSNGKVQQDKPGANIKERLFARAKGRAKGERILTDTLKEWVVEEGGSASSVNTFTTYMVDEGVLKRIAKGQFSIA